MSSNSPKDYSKYHSQTRAVRTHSESSPHGEHSEPVYLTSSFVFKDAQQAAARFRGDEEGNIYARFSNPNESTFSRRLAILEEGSYGIATNTGMSAILTMALAHLKSGDHVVCADCVFGTTIGLFRDLMAQFAIKTTFVPLSEAQEWRDAICSDTKILFCETPANPTAEIADLQVLADIAHENNALLVVDNCFCTPHLQKPLKFGADVVMHSATKFIDGQGRCLGGALITNQESLYKEQYSVVRTAGTGLNAFNSWVLAKSLETLSLRMQKHCDNALALALWLQEQPQVEQVNYSALPSHPQRELAKKQHPDGGGGVLSFQVKGDRKEAWTLINRCQLLSVTANLGDAKSTITHPATTTHWRMSAQERENAGISENMIRISVGLEHIDDIINDIRF